MLTPIGPSLRVPDWHAYRCDLCSAVIDSPYAIERVMCGCVQLPLYGPGSELVGLLHELGARNSDQCNCAAKASQMNAWGPDGCREHRGEIIAWLKEAAWQQWVTTQVSQAWSTIRQPWFSLLDPVGSIVDEAIRRAESATPITLDQILPKLTDGVQSAEQLATKLDVVRVFYLEHCLDQFCQQGKLASLVIDGQKRYGLPAKSDIMSETH